MAKTGLKQACVFGGSGFIGRQAVRELARAGYRIKVAGRAAEKAYFLRVAGDVGQIVPLNCDYGDEISIRTAVRGCDVVVNCIGILHERRKGAFTRIHTELARAIAKACVAEGVGRFIHISAMACEENHSKYGKSKRNGELAVFENFARATILRPGVVFGADDNFFNLFARLAVLFPVLPLIGGGKTKFQPVYVGDVADAIMACIANPQTAGKIYDLAGPETVTLRGIYEKLFEHTGRKRRLLPLPWRLAALQGALMGLLPSPLLSADQVESLKTDVVASGDLPGLADLGLRPVPMDVILPAYLTRYRPGGRFGGKKRA